MLELAAAEDQDSVEAVGAEGAYPSFGMGVRVRGLDRRYSAATSSADSSTNTRPPEIANPTGS
jgi:hypothetical protein